MEMFPFSFTVPEVIASQENWWTGPATAEIEAQLRQVGNYGHQKDLASY